MKKLYAVLWIVLAVALLLLYYNFNPAVYSFFPKCPFHRLSGLNCPGCGSQRAIYNLLHGNVVQAMHNNALLVLCIPFLWVHFGYQLKAAIVKKPVKWRLIYHPLTPRVVLALVIVFWIGRNLSFYYLHFSI